MIKEKVYNIEELIRRMKSLEDRVRTLESQATSHGKLIKEQGVHLTHIRKSSRRDKPLKN